MARKKKQDNTSDNIQKTVNDASVSEKKTSQKKATRSKVEDASSNKKPEIAELEDRLGLSIDYNEEENVITLTPNRPQQIISVTSDGTRLTPHQRKALFASTNKKANLDDAEFVVDRDEVPDYIFGEAAQQLTLINRCELYLIGRAFTPSIVENLWEPTDDDPSHTYGDMADCSIETFNSDPWNLFIYSKSGRRAVTFGELTTGTFYLQCAAAEYVPNSDDPSSPLKQPMRDVYGRQMYRKVYFNGQIGQFPRINISSYQGEDPQTGEMTTTQYDKYQYVANENSFSVNHMVWPQRKVTFYFNNLNFLCNVEVVEGYGPDNTPILKNDNNSRNEQVVEFLLPARWAGYDPSLNMTFKITVRKNVGDIQNAYKYAVKASEDGYWGGTIGYTTSEDPNAVLTQYSIRATRSNTPPDTFEEIIVSSMYPQNTLSITQIDQDINVHIQPVRKNFTKKFIIMSDGNLVVTDITELNDYLNLYTQEQIQEMNTPDQIIVSYKNTIGFLSTSPEWPWNRTIRVSAAIASEYQGIRFKAIGRYKDPNNTYDEYVKYRQGIMSDFTWDDSAVTIEGITCTPSHNGEGAYSEEEPYIDYSISISKQAIDTSQERQIFYLAFEPIPKFVITTLKIFIGYDPANLQVTTASGTRLDENSDCFVVNSGNLWSFRYTTQQNDFGLDSRNPPQEGFLFEITNDNISTSQYSHVFISDNTTAIRDRVELPASGSMVKLSFTGRMYHNMSLFVRPLVAAKIKFSSNEHDSEFDTHFYIEYNGSPASLGTEYQLTSEQDLIFFVKHDNDPNPTYTHISVDVNYGSHSWSNLGGGASSNIHIIPNTNTLIFTISGFGSLMDPSIEYCYVKIKLSQIYSLSVNIQHPDPETTDYWPGGSSAVLRGNSLTIGGQSVTAESITPSATGTTYTFSTIYGNSGTGYIDINDQHCCGRAVKPDGSYEALTTNQYARQSVSIQITVNAGSGGYLLDIQPFKEMHYQFMYQSTGGGGHVTVVPYTFDEYYNGWPANMDNTDDMTQQPSWQPSSGNDMTSLVTPDLCMPLFGFRLLPTVDPATHNLDIFSKMTLGLLIVDDGGSIVAGPWPIASDYTFEDLNSYYGVCPGSLTNANARAYFYPEHNGEPNVTYQFVVQMASQIAAEDLRITKVVYAKNTGGTDTVSEDSGNPGINAIGNDARLPGENPSNASGNLEVHVHVPHTLDTDHTLSLEFLDSSGGQLNAMYPMDTVATLVSSNIYKFTVTTKQDELYCVQSPNHTYYSGDNQYTMKVKYNDNQYHWLDVETCTYYMHPVFKLWFNDGTTNANSFSFDDSGNATIYFSVHIAGAPDASHPNGTTRTPNSGAYPGDPDMNLPAAGSTYNQTQWNASGCVLQIANAPGLTFACDGVTHVVSGGGHFYKLEVSGGVGFSGKVTFTLNVFNKSKTATLRNIVTFSNITWWNGSSMTPASNMASAYLSPVTRFGTSGNPTNVLSMTAAIDSTAAASLDLDSATLTCGLNCGGRITCSAIHPASGTNLLSLSVTVDFSSSEHPEYGAQKIDDWNLSKRNNEHPELSDYASMLYTGRPIPFTLSIDDFSYTFYVKLGPVLFIWVNNTTGGELKPHTGQEHVVRARAREWYSLDGGATVRDTGNYYGTGEDTSYTVREYYAKFEYYNGSTYSEIPNVTPSSSSIKSQRTGNGFNIVAPTCWQDSTGKWYNGTEDHTTPTGPGDWGAWRITITDESHATTSGKMRVTMQVFDHYTPTHSLYNWYPVSGSNATFFEMNVRDFMTVASIKYWTGGTSTTNVSTYDDAVFPPVLRSGSEATTLWIYLLFAETSSLNLAAATCIINNSSISSVFSVLTDDTDGTESGNHYDLIVKANLTASLDAYNLGPAGATFYTGMSVPFKLTIPVDDSSELFEETFSIPLGPVMTLHHETPNSYAPHHTDGAILKPEVGNQCISQTRGHEWYMGTDNVIHMTSNLVHATEQNHIWDVTWSYNGTALVITEPAESPYNRQFVYRTNEDTRIKVQHPATWTESNGTTSHSGDPGAWLISILNATDPATGQEFNGQFVGTVSVNDDSDSIPTYKKVHQWYPAQNTVYGIYNVGISKVVLCTNIGSPMGNPSLSDSQTIWQASDGGTIKLPASLNGFKLVIFANIPQYMNDEVNSSTWASKVHILPGNNNLYSYRLTGTNSRFYLDVWPWYTKKLSAAGRSTHNATHYVAVTVGSIYDSGSFGRTDADGYWISKNSNTANPYQIKIVTSDTEIQPDDQSGTVYAFNYTLDGVIDLKAGSNASDGYKVLGVHINESTTIRVWHTLITNATKRETNPVPNYTVPDEQITPSNISFTNGSGSAITMPSTVDVQVSAYQQDSETHLYYVDVTLRNTANMANYEDLPSTMHMKVTIGRRSVTRVFYLAYANLDEALLRESNGLGGYEYNYFWNRELGEPLGLPCAYKSDMDIKLLFNGFPGGPAADGHLITEIKFDYPGTTGDELGNLFDGLFTSSNDQWVGPTLTADEHIFTGLTTRNGYYLGSYEEYNIIIKTADGHKYIQKFSFPTMCIFNGIWIEPSCAWESGGVTYGLFIPEHDNQFTFQFRHQYKQWSTTQETFIHPLTSDRLTASNVKFYLCNSDETVISETNAIQVNSMGYQGADTTYSPSFNVYCTIKLVSPPSSEAMYKVVITNNTCPSGTPYLYEDEYLSVSTDTGILRVRQLSFFCFGGGE